MSHADTLATLTPLQTPIFDDDVIAQMEQHIDAHVACDVPTCDHTATARLVMRCCRASVVMCDPHLHVSIVRTCAAEAVTCRACGHTFPHPMPSDVFKVVDL